MNKSLQFVETLFEIFIFSLTSFDTLKYGCVTKTGKMLSFLPLINSSVTIELRFLLLIIPAIISSKTISTLPFFSWIVFFNIFMNMLHIIWIFNKSFRMMTMLSTSFFTLVNKKLIFCFIWIFCVQIYLIYQIYISDIFI